jgi:hypothetical protein
MQLGTLAEVYGRSGPYVSVHLDVSRDTEDARQQLDARWTTARHRLEHAEVPEKLVEEIGERVLSPVEIPGEVHRTVVAADGEVLLDDALGGHSVWPETVSVGPLPDLGGWVHQVDAQVSFLLVVADRVGADLDFYRALARPGSAHGEVEGSRLHIHKYHGGGWSHRRFQQRTENQWESNAREVADEVGKAVRRHRPRLLLLAGDERARSAIAASLDGVQTEVVQLRSGARNEGSSDEAMWAEVEQALAQVQAADQRELTDLLEQRWGRGSGAVLGLDDTLRALVEGRVDTLVVDLQRARESTVDATRFPGLPLPDGAAQARDLPGDQVLLAAGALTDARLTDLPADQGKGGGVAALLRWEQ